MNTYSVKQLGQLLHRSNNVVIKYCRALGIVPVRVEWHRFIYSEEHLGQLIAYQRTRPRGRPRKEQKEIAT
jgi:hypothetical protein